MIQAVPDILARIADSKRQELDALSARREELEQKAAGSTHGRRDFRAALLARKRAVIAEIKKASPSKGLLAEHFDPPAIAREYEAGGAACLSVLTDRSFFQGSFEHLGAARNAVGLPVLRKDFTISELHVIEAAAEGADAILLIAALLSERELRDWRELAAGYKMAAVVEVHDAEELARAVASGAQIIGVNNRNLRTFEVSLETSLRLAARIPSEAIRVAESGIHSVEDIRTLESAGFHTFLIGEHLMKAASPRAALEALLA